MEQDIIRETTDVGINRAKFLLLGLLERIFYLITANKRTMYFDSCCCMHLCSKIGCSYTLNVKSHPFSPLSNSLNPLFPQDSYPFYFFRLFPGRSPSESSISMTTWPVPLDSGSTAESESLQSESSVSWAASLCLLWPSKRYRSGSITYIFSRKKSQVETGQSERSRQTRLMSLVYIASTKGRRSAKYRSGFEDRSSFIKFPNSFKAFNPVEIWFPFKLSLLSLASTGKPAKVLSPTPSKVSSRSSEKRSRLVLASGVISEALQEAKLSSSRSKERF